MQLFDLAHFGLLKVGGADAKKLLQGQLTCHLDELVPNESMPGAHCNPQGRILSLFQLFEHHQDYFLFMPREMVPHALAALKKYAVFYKVILTDASDEFTRLGYIPESPNESFSHDAIAKIKIAKQPERYLILMEKNSDDLQSIQSWKQLDIENGRAYIYPETIGRFLPHEINLHLLNGISLNKGCYTGQEIIARMHYLGKLKTHCYQATVYLNTPPMLGSDLLNESSNIAGTLVDFSYQSNQQYQLLFISDEEKVKHSLFLNQSQITLK